MDNSNSANTKEILEMMPKLRKHFLGKTLLYRYHGGGIWEYATHYENDTGCFISQSKGLKFTVTDIGAFGSYILLSHKRLYNLSCTIDPKTVDNLINGETITTKISDDTIVTRLDDNYTPNTIMEVDIPVKEEADFKIGKPKGMDKIIKRLTDKPVYIGASDEEGNTHEELYFINSISTDENGEENGYVEFTCAAPNDYFHDETNETPQENKIIIVKNEFLSDVAKGYRVEALGKYTDKKTSEVTYEWNYLYLTRDALNELSEKKKKKKGCPCKNKKKKSKDTPS